MPLSPTTETGTALSFPHCTKGLHESFGAPFLGLPPIYAMKSKQKFSLSFNDVTTQLIC